MAPEFVEACVACWMEHAPLALVASSRRTGIVEFLHAARTRGLRLGVCSDYPPTAKLLVMGIAHFFDVVSVMFYGSTAMLFFGAFIMRYRLELIVSFPLVALVMAIYLALACKEDSAVQRPEGLYREPMLMAVVIACTVLMGALLFIDIPILHQIFIPMRRVFYLGGMS
jgi:hypothetical protein